MSESYYDEVLLNERFTEVAFRDDSLEINKYSSSVFGKRYSHLGCWFITSCQSCSKLDEVPNPRVLLNDVGDLGGCEGLADADLYSGQAVFGTHDFREHEVAKVLRDLCLELKSSSIADKCEGVVTYRVVRKEIVRSDGSKAKEERNIVEIDVALMKLSYGIIGFGSTYKALILTNLNEVLKLIDRSFREAGNNLIQSLRAKSPNIYMLGKADIVLDHEASAALMHEVSHLLDPNYSSRLRYGIILGPPEFELYDDPLNPRSPSIRLFDDEGVRTFRRVLIEEGKVIDFHHTRATAYKYRSRPGSAYGLFHKPIPFHTSLVVRPGDWRDNEVIEETKRGVFIKGAAYAALEPGHIRIIPMNSYIINNGELGEVIKVREVRIPISKLRSINAIGRSYSYRVSREKDWLVTEVSPMIRLEGYIA